MDAALPLIFGFAIDLVLGDPHSIPHPVVLMGKLISFLERVLRSAFSKTERAEKLAGAMLWLIVAVLSFTVPWLLLRVCFQIHPVLAVALESIMCWQIIAARSLQLESMKVCHALLKGDVEGARCAVSMIVGRDTQRLDAEGITKAAVETVAENTSDGIVAPLLFMALGGAPLGFFYKAVNTMDSMLGYVEPPYKNFGFVPAKMDDIANYIPARISAMLMLLSGALLGFDLKNGWRIFKRDRYKHASPNSAQTESVCSGLLGLQLAGDAWYHGVLHKKEFIGDKLRNPVAGDIRHTCRIMYLTSFLALMLSVTIRL